MMRVREIANRLWKGLASPRTALLILVVLSLIQVTALILPQIPVPASQSTAYNRWLAEFRPRIGPQTGLLASLGLLTVRSSPIMRAALGLLGLLVAANLDSVLPGAEQAAPSGDGSSGEIDPGEPGSQQVGHGAPSGILRAGHVLLVAGGILAIGGWATQMLWGWLEPGVIAWPGTDIQLPQHALTFEQPKRFLGLWTGKVGLYVLNRGERTGLEVRATHEDEPLLLLPSVTEEPKEVLQLALTAQEPEAFFATEEASLIFRLVQLPDAIQVQAYRSPSGEIEAEALLDETTNPLVLSLDDAEVVLTPVLLPDYEVIYNPGAVFEATGMACLVAGTAIRLSLSRKQELVGAGNAADAEGIDETPESDDNHQND